MRGTLGLTTGQSSLHAEGEIVVESPTCRAPAEKCLYLSGGLTETWLILCPLGCHRESITEVPGSVHGCDGKPVKHSLCDDSILWAPLTPLSPHVSLW